MQIAIPPPTRYDLISRYLVPRAGALFFHWALRLSPAQIHFNRWLPTALTLPGIPERLCDGVAELLDQDKGGVPFAAILEIQTVPDANMPGRLMVAGGLVWLSLKPTNLRGDRYNLVGIVVNLTGIGNAERTCELGTSEWILKPVEIDMETLNAAVILDMIERGEAPRELLAWIALMRGGDDPGIIQRWRTIVDAETNLQRRADYALVQVFAERVQRGPLWQTAVEGLNMVESPIIASLLDERDAKARREGKTEGKTDSIIRLLRKKHGTVPEDLATNVRACKEVDQLDHWLDKALDAESLDAFRQMAGL